MFRIRRPEINLSGQIQRQLDRLPEEIGQSVSDEVTRLVLRSKAGVDKNNRQMPRLSDEYRRRKVASGRRGVPDLLWSGRLLESITYRIERTGSKILAIVYVLGDQAPKARGLIEGGRDFLGFTKEALERLRFKVQQILRGRL